MMVTWSRRVAGRYDVVAASIRSGHGGLLLGTPGVLANGGAQWIAPVAWSPDGRTLLVARGNPFAPLAMEAVDPTALRSPAAGQRRRARGSFDGDGAWLDVRDDATAALVGRVAALARLCARAARECAARCTSRCAARPASAAARRRRPPHAAALALPAEVASWGEPTGVAIEPDGSGFVLGQRRGDDDGVHERLVEVQLACTQTAVAPRDGRDAVKRRAVLRSSRC